MGLRCFPTGWSVSLPLRISIILRSFPSKMEGNILEEIATQYMVKTWRPCNLSSFWTPYPCTHSTQPLIAIMSFKFRSIIMEHDSERLPWVLTGASSEINKLYQEFTDWLCGWLTPLLVDGRHFRRYGLARGRSPGECHWKIHLVPEYTWSHSLLSIMWLAAQLLHTLLWAMFSLPNPKTIDQTTTD